MAGVALQLNLLWLGRGERSVALRAIPDSTKLGSLLLRCEASLR